MRYSGQRDVVGDMSTAGAVERFRTCTFDLVWHAYRYMATRRRRSREAIRRQDPIGSDAATQS
jgi:hypothetical protein